MDVAAPPYGVELGLRGRGQGEYRARRQCEYCSRRRAQHWICGRTGQHSSARPDAATASAIANTTPSASSVRILHRRWHLMRGFARSCRHRQQDSLPGSLPSCYWRGITDGVRDGPALLPWRLLHQSEGRHQPSHGCRRLLLQRPPKPNAPECQMRPSLSQVRLPAYAIVSVVLRAYRLAVARTTCRERLDYPLRGPAKAGTPYGTPPGPRPATSLCRVCG